MRRTKLTRTPIEGEWFEVNPKTINQNLFNERREDKVQEEVRQLILEAFYELKTKPEKYGKPFQTCIPIRTWKKPRTIEELQKLANNKGGHMADWVEQALEWAQRIANGETWEKLCNYSDTADCYRVIVWKNRYKRLVGGSRNGIYEFPATNIYEYNYYSYYKVKMAVPLVAKVV